MNRIRIADGKCIGSGNCVEIAEGYFDQSDDDGTVIVLRDEVADADLAQVRSAANVCPVAAILVESSGSSGA